MGNARSRAASLAAQLLGTAGLAILTAPSSAAQSGFAAMRYDDNWSAVCDEPSDSVRRAIKCITLSERARMDASIGGEWRERIEWIDAPDFHLGGSSADSYVLHRALLHADMRVGDGLRAFVELGSHHESGRSGGPVATDENRLDTQQVFVDAAVPLANGRATVRVGRQAMTLGSSRLVSGRESPNIPRAFDGIRVFWKSPALRIDAFRLKPVTIEPGYFDDDGSSRERLWGIHAALSSEGSSGALDAYMLGYEREAATFAIGTARERRTSLGARVYGNANSVDWNLELVWQFGSIDEQRIRAWTIASDTGYVFDDVRFSPRLGLKADIATGDRNPHDGRLETFNALYPNPTYFSEASLIAPANIVDVQPSLTLSIRADFSLLLGWDVLWKHQRADAVYTPPPPLAPVPSSTGQSRDIGHQIRIEPAWRPSPHFELKAAFVRFFAGDALALAGASNVDFAMISAKVRF